MGRGYFLNRRFSPPDPADRFARLGFAAFLAGAAILVAGLVLMGSGLMGFGPVFLAGMAVCVIAGLFMMVSIVCGFMVVRQKPDVVKWMVPAMVLAVFMAVMGGLIFAFARGFITK